MPNPNTKPTFDQVKQAVTAVTYTRLPSGKAIVCEITMTNGYVVHGISALVDLDNYNEELGKKAAYDKALAYVWANVAFLTQQRMHEGQIESQHDLLVAAHIAENNNQPKAI